MLEKKHFVMLTGALISLAIALASTATILAEDPPMLTPTPPHHSPTGGEERASVERASGEPIEIVARRSVYAKHYYIGPGQFQAVISAAPMHYLDEDGRWQDIDTNITKLPDGTFASEANSVKMRFPAQLGLASAITAEATTYPAIAPSWQRAGGQGAQEEPADVAASSRDFSIAWTPQAVAFSDEEGHTTHIANVAATAGDVHDNVIRYPEAFPYTTEEFKMLPAGFKHNLILSALPEPPADYMSTLDYIGGLALPPEIVLFVDGVEQKGDFATGSHIDLRDQQGEIVGYLMAPYVYEQDDPRQMVRGTYAIHHEAEKITLAVRTSLAWLTDPNRNYPVVIDPALYIGFWSDTTIVQGQPDGNGGNLEEMYVGYDPNPDWQAERGLAIWDVGSLPEDATINSAYTELYLLDYLGSSACQIHTHRVTSPWLWDEVTWNQRYSGANWSTPGGDYDPTPSAAASVGTNVNNWINMGDITSLVTGWHNGTYPNYGVLYRKDTESGAVAHDRWFAQYSYSSGTYVPRLYVNYTFTGSITTLSAYTPLTRSAPSNEDYYVHATPSQWYWRAIGIRPPGDADYDIELYDDGNFWDMLAASWYGTGTVDFVVIGGEAAQVARYPKVLRYSGSGNYQIEFAPWSGGLIGEGTYGPYTMNTNSVLRTWDVWGPAGTGYKFTVQPTSGDADLGIALYAPSSAGGYDYMGRSDAVASADNAGAGGPEAMTHQFGSSAWYGLVVWNNGATSSTQFTITIGKGSLVYMPLIAKNYTPPCPPFCNGGFETGGPSCWSSGATRGLPAPVIVGNPGGGCFLGNWTARLGAVGGPDDRLQSGEIYIEQCFTVPQGASQVRFNYRMYSYGSKQGLSGKFYDTFEVSVNGQNVFLTGSPNAGFTVPQLWDSGCQPKSISIASYAGGNVTLRFSVHHHDRPGLATWVYVDDVTVQ